MNDAGEDLSLRRKQSLHALKKQLSIQSVRGGIQGKEGVIGEDGAIENDDEDEEMSNEGMRTRRTRIIRNQRKKMSTEKSEVLGRTRFGALNAKQGEDKAAKVGEAAKTGTAPNASKKSAKPVANKANTATKSQKPTQNNNGSSSSGSNSSSQLSLQDAMKVVDIKTNNLNQKQQYRDVLPKFLYKPNVPLPDLSEYTQRFIEVRVHKAYVCR
mmetsp:Transcript_3905/g.5199  ORF Transcript_3905/g.5199 Transcript_3905/m.5199 type:complete len:213 (+) Transcript_3905:636-1274(+)